MKLPCAMACAVSLAGLASLLAVPATAAPARDGAVGHVCAATLGLDPGEKHYAACVQSLSGSLADLRAGQGMAVARRACLARGMTPGAADFNECELREADAAPPPQVVDDSAAPAGGRSYFETSRQEAWRRGELACARLGFDPAGSAFQSCAADLRGAL